MTDPTPGQAALAEVARLESARIYGRTCPEHKQRREQAGRRGDVSLIEQAIARGRPTLWIMDAYRPLGRGDRPRNPSPGRARQAKLPRGLERVRVELHWQPRLARKRDTDNPTPTLKACIDGLTKYGLTDDDDSAHVESGCVIEPLGARSRLWLVVVALRDGPV